MRGILEPRVAKSRAVFKVNLQQMSPVRPARNPSRSHLRSKNDFVNFTPVMNSHDFQFRTIPSRAFPDRGHFLPHGQDKAGAFRSRSHANSFVFR